MVKKRPRCGIPLQYLLGLNDPMKFGDNDVRVQRQSKDPGATQSSSRGDYCALYDGFLHQQSSQLGDPEADGS